MGDIADMHVQAYEAGLDPNEMDGADWADFLADENEPKTPEQTAEEISGDFRIFIMPALADVAAEGERPAETFTRLFPKISRERADAFFAVIEEIDGFPIED